MIYNISEVDNNKLINICQIELPSNAWSCKF